MSASVTSRLLARRSLPRTLPRASSSTAHRVLVGLHVRFSSSSPVIPSGSASASTLASIEPTPIPTPVMHTPQVATKTPRTLPAFSLANKVCLVTGAARGLGNEFCKAFIESGCTELAIVDLKEDEALAAGEELVKQSCLDSNMDPSDYRVIGVGCDVSSELSVQQAFRRVMDTYGRIDSVVASAGIVENYSAFDYPFDRIKRLYDINVHGAFFTAREAARHMIPMGGGSIVLVGSMSANIVNIPQPQTPYNAAKAAVKHMAASLAVEWAKKGVRVNCLSPGYMLTKLTRTILSHDVELKKTWESLTPMGRMGEPEDLSGAIVFLASDASRFMTGSEIRVDGGYCVI